MSFSLHLDRITTYNSREEAMIVRGLHINAVIDKINEIDVVNGSTGPRFRKVTNRSYSPSIVNDTGIMRGIHLREIINEINSNQ